MNKWNIKECKQVHTSVIPAECDYCNNKPHAHLYISKFLGLQSKYVWVCSVHLKKFCAHEFEI